MAGKLIVVEGIDGSGKATQSKLLHDYYAEIGQPVRLVTFPDYASPSSTLVKMYLAGEIGDGRVESVNAYAASSFYAADRYISFKNGWSKDYQWGVVIADRYVTSNLIHQMVKLPKKEWPDFITWLEDYEYNKLGLPRPDLVIYLDLPVDTALALMDARYDGDDTKKDIHEKNRGYLIACLKAADYAASSLGWRCIACTEQGAMRSIEAIAEDIKKYTAWL